MKRGETDIDGQADERLDALVDEALRQAVAPGALDLKPQVMAAWDERTRRAQTGSSSAAALRSWQMPLLKPAAALAAVVLLVAAALVWQHSREAPPEAAAPHSAAVHARTAAPAAETSPAAPGSAGQEQLPGVTETGASARAGSARAASPAPARAAVRRAPRPTVVVEFPLEETAARNEDTLHGAPAGDLGDPIAPLPGPPSILITPVASTPTVTEMSWPVSNFPAYYQPPGAGNGEPGQTRGEAR